MEAQQMTRNATATAAKQDISGIDELLDSFSPTAGVPRRSILIPLLQAIQGRFGWLPPEALERVSSRFRIPLSSIYGVVTFYAQFYLEPRGRHIVKCCRGTACHVRGATNVLSTIEQVLSISDGETTPDMQFSVETVACLGTCFLAPVMMIDENYYGKLDSAKVRKVFKEFSNSAGAATPDKPGRKKSEGQNEKQVNSLT
jgi:NADH-quinone oxidoreductase subunit E